MAARHSSIPERKCVLQLCERSRALLQITQCGRPRLAVRQSVERSEFSEARTNAPPDANASPLLFDSGGETGRI